MVTFTGYEGEPQERPDPPSSPWTTLAKAVEWEKNSTGWREKVLVEGEVGGNKLTERQLIT